MATIITAKQFQQELAQLVMDNFGSIEEFARAYNQTLTRRK